MMSKLETKLDELLETKVATFDSETGIHKKDTKVWEIADGFDLFIAIEGDKLVLMDYQDDEYRCVLGKDVNESLRELNAFEEYFNGWTWYSDFEFYSNAPSITVG